VRVISGKDLAASDVGGTSDPYVGVEINGHKEKTKVVKKCLNPHWNETFRFNVSPSDYATFTLYDWDRFGKDDALGKVTATFEDLIQGQESVKWLTLTGCAHGQIEVGLLAEDFSGANAHQQQQQGYGSQQGYYPPPQGYYPPQQGYYPPQQGYYPPQQGYSSQGYPPQQAAPQSGGHPPSHGPPGGIPAGTIFGPTGKPVRKPHGISDPEILDCLAKFKSVDKDNNGTIDKSELKNLLAITTARNMSDGLLERFVSVQMQSLDSNKSGSVDFDEFLALYAKFKSGQF